MIEDLENKLRSHINLIYFGKTKDIVNTLRSSASLAVEKERRQFADKVHAGIGQ
jgi:capping protein beta